MIPKYFRCGDPSQNCPLAVSREIIKEDAKWACPCSNPTCADFREPVSWAEGVTRGRPWIIYGGAAALVLAFVLILLLGGRDPCPEQIAGFQARQAAIEAQIAALQSGSKPKTVASLPADAVVEVSKEVAKLEQDSGKALANNSEFEIEPLRKEIVRIRSAVKNLGQSADRPNSGSGVGTAEAKRLMGQLQDLDAEVEQQLEQARTDCPKHVVLYDELRGNLEMALSKVRSVVSPSRPSTPNGSSIEKAATDLTGRLDKLQARMDAFVPPVPLPFAPSEADLRVVASQELSSRLVGPLLAAWGDTEVIAGPSGSLYLNSADKGKILVEPCTDEEGFELLAAGKTDLLFADRAPSEAELQSLGEGFKQSRSVAEVVALDALTLLVHNENPAETYEVGEAWTSPIAAGRRGSEVHRFAERFGLSSQQGLDVSGDEAALKARNVLALGLYHLEAENLKAKRLAVKASSEASALKPSPFTIATEDYAFTYRIVSWTSKIPSDRALEFVKFVTSNPGQAVVEKSGFVDLRLRPMQGQVDPVILAALGEAVGSKTLTSAVRLSTNFRFEVREAKLDLKAQADLERLPRYVASTFPTHQVVILGFTDSDGGPEINTPLSIERATAVANQLRKSKVDTKAAGLGPAFPVDSNQTEGGKARNRRAEVWVVKL